MENIKIPYLCGGTFFFLLVQAKRQRTKAREREKGIVDGLKDPDMMERLIWVITGDETKAYGDSLKKNTSQFRECHIDGSVYIPFDDSITANNFDRAVLDCYEAVLTRMSCFTESFINPTKAEWLVSVLLDVIEKDSNIEDDAHFCIQRDGAFLSSTDVLDMVQFELQPFLVGILHYILMHRSDNISGQATLEDWGTKVGKRSERRLKADFPLGKSRTVSVSWYVPDIMSTEAKMPEDTVNTEQEPECAEAEVVEEYTDAPKQENPKDLNQSVFINSGSGVQIGINYGTIDLSHRK